MYKARIGQTTSDQLPTQSKIEIARIISPKFTLSWSHYVFLMAVDNTEERHFYEIEAA
jgi:hypothetical protein